MTSRNVAVFIDAENLFMGYGKLRLPDLSMAEMLEQVEEAASREAGAGSIALAKAYANWSAPGLEEYRRDVERAGVRTVQVFSVGKADKNAADIELVVDCLRAATDLEQLEVFVIVSADGDFVPLVRRLHELDKYVVGATLAAHSVNSVLEQEVDHYVSLKAIVPPPSAVPVFSVPGAVPPAASHPRRAAPPRRAAEPPAKPVDEKAAPARSTGGRKKAGVLATAATVNVPEPVRRPSGRPEWHRLAQEIPVVHEGPAGSPGEYKVIIKQVLSDPKVRSFCDQLANHGGTLPILALAIRAAAPRLSPSDARVSSLSRALRFALAGTQYALARESDDVQPVLVRRATEPAGMLPDLSIDDIVRGTQ